MEIAPSPERIVALQEGGVVVTVHGGMQYSIDLLYPAMGCDVSPGLAVGLGAEVDEVGSS